MDAYIRVSRRAGREGESFQSPDIQREQIATWAKLRGVTIAAEHVDIDQTGKKFVRPGLDDAMRRIETGQTGGLVAMNVKRFGRSLLDGLETIKRIRDAEAVFASVQDGLDTSNDTGRLVLNMMLAMGEWELERITDANDTAQGRAIRRGVHFKASMGYVKGSDGRLVPGPMADAVRLAFRMRGAGAGWAEIADRLNAEHPRDDVAWLPSVLPELITRRVYLGEAYHGKHRKAEAHPPLVTAAEFEAAQTPRAPGNGRGKESLLRGLIRCAGCRYLMKPDIGGRNTAVYRCQTRHGAGRCPAPASVTRRVIDQHVEAQFLARYGEIELAGAEVSDALARGIERVAALEQKLDELADDRLRDSLGHDRHLAMCERVAGELGDAQAELHETRRAALGIVAPDKDIWDELAIADRRRVLAEGIDCVVLRRTGLAPIGDRSLVLWRGEAPDDLPGRGVRPDSLVPLDW
jgi:DNA invertase Pin-like site-specific DNA recombinase